jgi:uncharacterized membrane protein (UPF0127 family)
MLEDSGRPWVLRNLRTRQTIATELEGAFDRTSRRQGLLGRTHLPQGSALILAPCGGIHTWFMRFPIDVLFVSKDGTVTRAVSALGPWRVRVSLSAHATVEFPAGTIARTGTRRGDVLCLERT